MLAFITLVKVISRASAHQAVDGDSTLRNTTMARKLRQAPMIVSRTFLCTEG